VALLAWAIYTYRDLLDQLQEVYDLVFDYSDEYGEDVGNIIDDYNEWYPVVEPLIDRMRCIQQASEGGDTSGCPNLGSVVGYCSEVEGGEMFEKDPSCGDPENTAKYLSGDTIFCREDKLSVLDFATGEGPLYTPCPLGVG